MTNNETILIEATRKAIAMAKAMDPKAHFARMVARGIIDREGRPSAMIPGAEETNDATHRRSPAAGAHGATANPQTT